MQKAEDCGQKGIKTLEAFINAVVGQSGSKIPQADDYMVAIAGQNNYHPIMVAFSEIEEVARRIGEQTEAKAVVLFGSHARGQAGMDSDVDLLVIAQSDLPRHKRSRQLHLMFKPYPFAMDILVYTPEEVDSEREFELSFISRILREGKRLYGQTV